MSHEEEFEMTDAERGALQQARDMNVPAAELVSRAGAHYQAEQAEQAESAKISGSPAKPNEETIATQADIDQRIAANDAKRAQSDRVASAKVEMKAVIDAVLDGDDAVKGNTRKRDHLTSDAIGKFFELPGRDKMTTAQSKAALLKCAQECLAEEGDYRSGQKTKRAEAKIDAAAEQGQTGGVVEPKDKSEYARPSEPAKSSAMKFGPNSDWAMDEDELKNLRGVEADRFLRSGRA